MKKRVRGKFRGKKKILEKDYSVKETLAYRLIVLFFIVLCILVLCTIIIFLFGFNLQKNQNLNEGIGDLGSSGLFKVEGVNPNGSIVSFFVNEEKTFSVNNSDYDKIEWYLDGKNIANNSKSVLIKNKIAGNHTLEVRINKGSQVDSKMWKIVIEDVDLQRKFIFDAGYVMFLLIIIVLGIIICLFIWLIISDILKKRKEIKLELKVVNNKSPGFLKKRDPHESFNVPR